jgi:hypothetical protein
MSSTATAVAHAATTLIRGGATVHTSGVVMTGIALQVATRVGTGE